MGHRKFGETEEQMCRRKLPHPDFLSALQHAQSLHDPLIIVFPCDICGSLHLGHIRGRYALHCEREFRRQTTALCKVIRVHERLKARFEKKVQEQDRIIDGFKQKFEDLIIANDPGGPYLVKSRYH